MYSRCWSCIDGCESIPLDMVLLQTTEIIYNSLQSSHFIKSTGLLFIQADFTIFQICIADCHVNQCVCRRLRLCPFGSLGPMPHL